MHPPEYKKLLRDGLWDSNPGLVQLLGLCPLLAISNSVVNALGLGLATLCTLVLSNTLVSAIRHQLQPAIRLPVFVLIIASAVTSIELLMNAWFHRLYLVLGIFIPLIVTNCIIVGRAETFASRNRILPSLVDGFSHGLGFALVLLLLGAIRELLGHGTLLADAQWLLGPAAKAFTVTLIPHYSGFLIAVLPPGAFLLLGFLVAGKRWLEQRRTREQAAPRCELPVAEMGP